MLKALRAASVVVTIVSLCTVAEITIFTLKGNPEIRAFLQKPGIVELLIEAGCGAESTEDAISPLVASARAFADRIDPYIPPPPIIIADAENQTNTTNKGGKGSQSIEVIKGPETQSFKFDLLATVRYVSDPEKSLALFQSGGRQEWFYRGQTVGRHKIEDIRDGRVTLAQPGQKLQEIFVPPKGTVMTLLK